jgi:broad specificity phosphatase PhoE
VSEAGGHFNQLRFPVRLYLLRHGETDWNVEHRLQGSRNTYLNRLGICQAESRRSYFDRIHLAAIYSSSLERALHTAVLAAGRPSCIIPGFDERGFGDWEGSLWDDLTVSIPEFNEKWNDNSFCPPNGESRFALFDRVWTALAETVLAHDPSAEVLIVGHGGSGHAILCALLGYPIEARSSLPELANGSLTILEQRSSEWHLVGQIPATVDSTDQGAENLLSD